MKISQKNLIILIVIIVLFLSLIFGTVYLKRVANYKQAVKETTFDNINISDVSDGVYIGEYDVDFIYVKVEVTVDNGEITNINILEHKNGRGESAEVIVREIISEQKIDVDAISSATNSSTTIKKAVENALQKGL